MKQMRWQICMPLASLLVACSPPVTQVSTVTARPQLSLTHAVAGETLFVDDVAAGDATAFAAPKNALLLEHGTHVITVKMADQVVYSQTIYFGEDTIKNVDLPEMK